MRNHSSIDNIFSNNRKILYLDSINRNDFSTNIDYSICCSFDNIKY